MRFIIAAAIVVATLGATAANAQTPIEGRVDRLEHEMRAVQRKVFPGGAGAEVEPQIVQQPNTAASGTPATSPVADLTQRVAALETQVASLTGQIEQNQNHLRQLDEAVAAYRRSTDLRLKALEDGAAAAGAGHDANGVPAAAVIEPPASLPPSARPAGVRAAEVAAPVSEAPAAPAKGGRAAQLAAIERPKTSDPAEDGYVYGYRLWQAKFYPEAMEALKEVVAKYPKHRRASYAQNLLGRAYLDAGAPSLAAVSFYDNYKKNPNGERAPDSLLYLAKALTALKKPSTEVCKVYAELNDLYGDRISAEMKADVVAGSAAAKCK